MEHDLYKDMFSDGRHQRKMLTIIIILQSIIILGLICGMVYISMNSQKLIKESGDESNRKLAELFESVEFVTEYTIDTSEQSTNNGYINVNK